MGNLPLEDITILDLSWVLAGPHATRQFKELGARIIKVESSKSVDVVRTGAQRLHNKNYKQEGGWAYNDHNRGKFDIGINLKSAQGREILEELLKISDAVVCNYGTNAFRKLHLHYDDLKKIKEDVIVLNASGLGDWGPYSNFVTFAPCLMGLTGMTGIIGYEDNTIPYDGYPPLADYLGSLAICNFLIAAIEYRRKTGKGQFIDLSQGEAASSYMGVPILDWQVNKKKSKFIGNRHYADSAAPHNVYKCKGDDSQWCALSVADDEEWIHLKNVIDPEDNHLNNSRFETLALRIQHKDELDSYISEWMNTRTAQEAATILQNHGVSAGPVQSAETVLYKDQHLVDRGFWKEITFEPSDQFPPTFKVTGPIINSKEVQQALSNAPAPSLGKDTIYILKDILHKDDAWIHSAFENGAVE